MCLARYENPDVALNTGMILREMLRHEALAKILLYSDRFYTFPDHIEKTTFGISCDAFANFKETLTRHKPMVAEYLEKNYDRVSDRLGITGCPSSPLVLLTLIAISLTHTVLHNVQGPLALAKLRHKTTITQASRRDLTGPDQF